VVRADPGISSGAFFLIFSLLFNQREQTCSRLGEASPTTRAAASTRKDEPEQIDEMRARHPPGTTATAPGGAQRRRVL
jgi:hypothetical protein